MWVGGCGCAGVAVRVLVHVTACVWVLVRVSACVWVGLCGHVWVHVSEWHVCVRVCAWWVGDCVAAWGG